jgi:hypothetical protein
MAGLVLAIPTELALLYQFDRDRRNKPGDDELQDLRGAA